VILVILAAVVLFALFGPAKPQPPPVASPAQQPATTTAGPRPQPAAPPVAQAKPQPSPRQQGEMSVPVAATGVTTETVNLGGGGAYDAKRYMTDKLQRVSPQSEPKKKR
jgi:hypothetical protein